jgi:organic radical activating enzyme
MPETDIRTSVDYPVMEHFYTLQGEGFHQGKAAYFIRLGGCDVGCTWCDVKESWAFSGHPQMSVDSLVSAIRATPATIAVITGGEPLLHNLDSLTLAIREAGISTHIETSGSSSLSGSWDWICLSPKKFKPPMEDSLRAANELKVIVYNQSDFKWAEDYAPRVSGSCKLYLQPEWSRFEKMIPSIISYIRENPKWELSLQIHKYINIP